MKITVEIPQGKSKIIIESSAIEEIIKELENIEKISEKISLLSAPSTGLPAQTLVESSIIPNVAPTELLKRLNSKIMADRILLLIYYLWKERKIDSVNTSEVRNILKEVREVPPSNLTDMLSYLSSKAMLTPATKKDKMKSWMLTRTGIEFIEKQLKTENNLNHNP